MKNIKQIKENIKASGLTGNDYGNELRNQALLFAKELAIDIICVPTSSNLTWEDALLSLAHITEVYFEIARTDQIFTFAEEFQREIYNISHEWSNGYLKWRSDLFGDEHTPDETSEQQAAAIEPETKPVLTERHKQQLAETGQMLTMAMESPDTPQGVKDCLYTIIFEASNSAGLPLGDVGLIGAAYPRIIEALPEGHGHGIHHSVQEILRLDTPVFNDFLNRKIDKEQAEAKVLDLSDSTIEDLARKLSDIMHDPNLPKSVHRCLADELNSNHIDFHTPENILGNLKELNSEVKDA